MPIGVLNRQSWTGFHLPPVIPAARTLLLLWLRRAKTRRALRDLPPWQLRDLGLSAAQARRESDKRFWRA